MLISSLILIFHFFLAASLTFIFLICKVIIHPLTQVLHEACMRQHVISMKIVLKKPNVM